MPHTVQETIFAQYQVGSKVNIEVDLIARYLERLLTKSNDNEHVSTSNISESMLSRAGFIK